MKSLNPRTLLIAVQELAEKDQALAAIVEKHGPPPLWERQPGFATLLKIILEQQVSLASSQAAFDKLVEAVAGLTPTNFLILTDEELKRIGFSRQKTRYGRELSNAILDGSLDLARLHKLEDEQARQELMKVKGIGRWTADIYLLMVMGRPDIWPQGDLALEIAIQKVKGLDKRPTPEEALEISQGWRPWRAVAARLLWHYYLSER